MSLLNSSLVELSSLLSLAVYLRFLGIHLDICILCYLIDHSYELLKKFFEISSTSLPLVFVTMELLCFKGVMLPFFILLFLLCDLHK
jgi:hypothetical protein